MSLVSPVLYEGATLEIRWIRPGALPTSMIDWFGPFPGDAESREDVYLVSPRARGLSVKIRGGTQLDLKVAGVSRGILHVPERARGKIVSWQKWAFPLASVLERGIESPDWISVRKIRRIRLFSLADDVPVERDDAGRDAAWCAVELTDVSTGGQRWWTLAFEAMGRPEAPRRTIDVTAELVFRDHLPDGVELGAADSMSYTDWLRNRPTDERRRPS